MERTLAPLAAACLWAAVTSASAAPFSAVITDQAGRPVADAVVMLLPDDKAGMPAPAARLASDRTIDQRDETFIPTVTIVPQNGRITFANNDNTMHQVYSFSPVKQFEFSLAHKQTSPPVVFDKAGVVAIGCNIHDRMIAFAFVAESPWTVLTDAQGRAQIADVPVGRYTAQVWHHRLVPGTPRPTSKLVVSAAPATLTAKVNLAAEARDHRRHGGSY